MTSALVQVDELRSALATDRPPLVLDVRWTLAGADRDGYLASRIPGAVFVDLDAELASPPGDDGRHPLPTAEQLTGLMRRVGIVPGRGVVVLDGGAGGAAARAWWCLRWAGHADVRVLDGGHVAWLAAGGPVESGEPAAGASGSPAAGTAPAGSAGAGTTASEGDVPAEPAPSDVVVRFGSMPTVDVDAVLAGTVGSLLDARAAERFRGEVEPVDPVAGHIPGAHSCPTTDLQAPDGRYLPAGELRDVMLSSAGIDDSPNAGPITAYCGSGVTAAQLVLAGHEAGLDLALYPGSWSHWVRDASRPVATGPET
ncbi:sulfurtransferase [Actinotalea sp. M2MS4P-6]|uniref:sulfurtransferase n=1 Tax=Actinotalea sp. M2MS4P-6 TaxID=2983762 RepID=UPI0021E35B93|nr:sulfurtransferase [Actinotalea sp. M2MS4P-6]MCV2393110.1 sulfurtransferase [Actinotalea sp. M2MS4P-6]